MYSYEQILSKVKTWQTRAGITEFCNVCGYPCTVDYDPDGYQPSDTCIYFAVDCCESIKSTIFSQVDGLFLKYINFEMNLREALYRYNIFEGHDSDTSTFQFKEADVDAIFNNSNADAVKAFIDTIGDKASVHTRFKKETGIVMGQKPFTGSPNDIEESLVSFYDNDFNLIEGEINDPFVGSIMKEGSCRYTHSFLPGKKRINLNNITSDAISVPLEYEGFLKINYKKFDYSVLLIDGDNSLSKIVVNAKQGRTRVMVFDMFFADIVLDDNDNIYYKFDNATKPYLVKIKDGCEIFIRTYCVFNIRDMEPMIMDGKDNKYLLLDMKTMFPYLYWTDKLCVGLFYFPKKKSYVNPKRERDYFRFVLKDK